MIRGKNDEERLVNAEYVSWLSRALYMIKRGSDTARAGSFRSQGLRRILLQLDFEILLICMGNFEFVN